MDSINPVFDQLLGLTQTGFSEVNQLIGLAIAILVALAMKRWRDLLKMALGAAIVFVLVGAVMPIFSGGSFQLPDVTVASFWVSFIAYFLGFLVAIAVFFFVKTLFVRSGGKHH